ncbi:MAG: HAMP domain-containing histidine kinase, partial [Peptostreptococcaceae bacterium]|nr:HAMP domain-containing histidine kinase [Peptostreptococcaceae bacterium]
MKQKKGLKFSFLVVALISLSLLLAMIPAAINLTTGGRGVMTSYMHDNKKLVEDDFYKSNAFDQALIRPLLYWTGTSIIDVDNYKDNDYKNYIEITKKSARQQLSYIKNIKYIAVNKETNEVYSNTDYKSIEDFKKNISGECEIDLSCRNDVISYTKLLDNKKFTKSNVNRYLRNVFHYDLEDFESCISINKNFENSGHYDKILEIKEEFNSNISIFEDIVKIFTISLILFIVCSVIYKKMKVEVLDKDSYYLKLYKIIPLEVYIIAGICALVGLISIIESYFIGFTHILDTLIYSFICIFGLLTIYYLLVKISKSYDKPIEIVKTSLVFRLINLVKRGFNYTKKSTKSVPLTKRVMILAILSVCIGTIGWFIGFFFGNTLLLILFAPILSLAIVIYYVYYLVKKLDYLAYIMEGTNRIKNGDIHYKLDIIGDDNFSSLAEDINNIREGLDKAIYNQVKSERMKSELITNVSHDLKTPLTSIINYIELIKKEENIEPEHIKDYVNVLDSKSKRLKVLIEDLFEASKASSGNLELNMEKIDITQLLRQAIGEMEEKLSKSNLDLKLRVPEE